MPDDILINATKPLIDAGILGSLCVLLAAAIVYLVRSHKAEMREEREAHQRTREAHIKAMEAGFGVVVEVKEAVQAMQETSGQWIELARAAVQKGGRE